MESGDSPEPEKPTLPSASKSVRLPSSNGKIRRWIACIALLLVVAIALTAYLTPHRPIARVHLPDGSELRLEYVTYGTDHRIPGAGRLVEWLTRAAAQRWPSLGIETQVAEYRDLPEKETPRLVLWFSRYDPRIEGGYYRSIVTSRGEVGNVLEDVTLELRDDSDFRVELIGGGSSSSPPLPHVRVYVEHFNRRAPDLHLRVKMQDQISEIRAPNPAAKISFPRWQPEALPQTRHIGAMDLVLRSLKVFAPAGSPTLTVAPEFETLYQGQPLGIGWETEGFELDDLTLSDATGNFEEVGPFSPDWMRDSVPARPENIGKASLPIPSSERAWKIQGRVRRGERSPVLQNEGLTLDPVPMPGPGQPVVIPLAGKGLHESLRFVMLLGPGRDVWQDGTFTETGAPLVADEEIKAFLRPNSEKPALRVNTRFTSILVLSSSEPKDSDQGSNVIRVIVGGQSYPVHYGGGGPSLLFEGDALHVSQKFDLAGWVIEEDRNVFRDYQFAPGSPVKIQIVPAPSETIQFFVSPPRFDSPPASRGQDGKGR